MSCRIVLDTNLRFSSICFGGLPRRFIHSLQPPQYTQLISDSMVHELRRVLKRESLDRKSRISGVDVEFDVRQILSSCELIIPNLVLHACRDPDDNRVLECAVSGHADFILTGDRDLLTLDPFRSIRILTIRDFLDSHLCAVPNR